MAFEGLTDKLQNAFKKLSGKGKLSEADVKAAMREVRMALLEADVNFTVVKDFIKKVTERAVGQEILGSLTPGQQVVKIVNDELTQLMGGTNAKLAYSPQPPTIYMLCGLQGAGKTTMAAKLGNLIKKGGKKPLLVACDVYRPAAIKQLQVVGGQVGVEVFEKEMCIRDSPPSPRWWTSSNRWARTLRPFSAKRAMKNWSLAKRTSPSLSLIHI